MKLKHSIPNLKHSMLSLTIALMCLIFLNNPITAHASNRIDAIVDDIISSYVNSDSTNVQGGTDSINNGVSYTRTGYMCYLVNKDGSHTDYPTRNLQCPNYSGIDGSTWIAATRRGRLAYGWFENGVTAPWDCTPWQEGGSPSNEPVLKEWLKAKTLDPNVANACQFVATLWGNDAMHEFGQDNYLLVIETLMNLQFSKANSAVKQIKLTEEQKEEIFAQCRVKLIEMVMSWSDEDCVLELEQGEGITYYTGDARDVLVDIYTEYAWHRAYMTIHELENQHTEGDVVGSRTYYGNPVIGTPANLIEYDRWNTTVFDSYLNKVAPHSEKIAVSEAGFTAYTGSADKLSDQEVHDYGVAMILVKCSDLMDPAQTTYNESQGDTPHQPPQESTGTTTIIKSYREKNPTTNTYTDRGTYYTSNIASNITIEDEPSYKVVAWKASTTGNTNITSLSWESSVPGLITDQGTTAASVTLPQSTKYLYVLLEKNATQVAPIQTTNYTLPQSTISRHITLSTPDAQLTLPKLSTHTFQWTNAALGTNCTGHTCGSESICDAPQYHECNSCEHGCSDTSLTHIHSSCDSDCGDWYCGGHECSNFAWNDQSLTRSLKNTKLASYPYITTDKTSWNIVSTGSNSISVWSQANTRNTTGVYPLSKSSLDYHTVIHRGETDVILAEWKNDALTSANTDLQSISSKSYKVGNTTAVSRYSGRKTSDYTTNFTVNIVDASSDKDTTYEITAGSGHGDCSPDTQTISLNSDSEFTAKPSVKVEVYPANGTVQTHTDVNNNKQVYTSGNIIRSGIMAKSGTIENFTPYVQMKSILFM